MDEPTLADDEAALETYAAALVDAVGSVAAPWIERLILLRAPELAGTAEVDRASREGAATVVAELGTLLERDIGEQPIGPLEVLRRGVRFATAVLRSAGVGPVARDEFAVRTFPDDDYDLTPASFGAVDPSLHEPGLMWGAAKAHVHLRRRREAASPAPLRVVTLSGDLMDSSRIRAAFPAATIVASATQLLQLAATADVVFVDLARVGDPALLGAIEARVIAFGSHVDDATLAAATAAGAEALPRSVFFRRLADGSL